MLYDLVVVLFVIAYYNQLWIVLNLVEISIKNKKIINFTISFTHTESRFLSPLSTELTN
jgi:hypothetical protein